MPSDSDPTKEPTKIRDRLLDDSPLLESSNHTTQEGIGDAESRSSFPSSEISLKNTPQAVNLGFDRKLEKNLLRSEELTKLSLHGQENLEPHGSDQLKTQESLEFRNSDQLRTQEQEQVQLNRFDELGRPRIEKSLKIGDDCTEKE